METLLEQLDIKFDDMSTQILDRSLSIFFFISFHFVYGVLIYLFYPLVNQMSTRVDALEASIQDIINGDISVPQSPSPGTPGGIRMSDSGM